MRNGFMLCSAVIVLIAVVSSTNFSGGQSTEDMLHSEKGSGSDDEDLSDALSDVSSQDDVTIRCYHCTGASHGHGSGCNMMSLRQNPEMYLTNCSGHCVNLTTGVNTIFDCTKEVLATASSCMQRQKMKVCVCATDFCNGPANKFSDSMELPNSQQGIRLQSEHEVNIVPPRTQGQDKSNITQDSANSAGHYIMLRSHMFFMVLWCHAANIYYRL